ncbi:hypothetical protein [Aestuariivita boseongensis]|uniref:hypothetical protein n=1 Tax=Aestuariivita boseongensis TaxID=1470562 RepID=UPI0006820161|nr:hypothetical protein [Aestuariivita boseongensis]
MIRRVSVLVFLLLTVVFGYFYYAQYVRWRDCFDQTGRCFDAASGTVYLEQSGVAWLTLTAASLAVALFQVYRMRQSKP